VGEEGVVARVAAEEIARELERVRRRTLALLAPLPDELLKRQLCDYMSPLVWDLGHIADFERLWLVDAVEGRSDACLETRFDAQLTPRACRGELTLPDRDEALEGLRRVRADALELLGRAHLASNDPLLRDGFVYRMVMQHEAQHQETMLQALDLLKEPVGESPVCSPATKIDGVEIDDEARIAIDSGPFAMGTEDRSRAYDNERLRHEVDVAAFAIERYPVSNRRWLAFAGAGGYDRSALWSQPGWDWLQETGTTCPQGWLITDDGWRVRRFGHLVDLDPREPVQHVSYWEAEAFARWGGARLPTEQEWEKAAAWGPQAATARVYPWGDQPPPSPMSAADELRRGVPPCLGTRPGLASGWGVEDLLGAVYQWTSSPFAPYPGFDAFPYAGYSEVFFGDEYRVLRGSSSAADDLLWRNTYRNWDLPQRRQIFAGVRLAYDV
jgi:iron(II)-dependent oxidoreductase